MKTIYLSIQKLIVVIGLLVMALSSQAQVLDLESTTEGALLPRMTTVQRTAITTASQSEIVYDMDTKSFWYWEDMQWNEIGAGGSTTPATTFFDCGVGISGDTLRNTLPAVRDTITLTSTEMITAETHVSICIDVDHTFVGDLDIKLISPNSGSTIDLSNRLGVTGDNFKGTCFTATAKKSITSIASTDAPFTGVYKPQQDLSALVGEAINGDWTLEIQDKGNGDDGIFNNWEINITNSFSIVAQKALVADRAVFADSALVAGSVMFADSASVSATAMSITDADNDTKIQVEESADEDKIRYDIGGTELLQLSKSANGKLLVEPQNGFFGTFYGFDAGRNSTGDSNTLFGHEAGQAIVSGGSNTIIGTQAGQSLISGSFNVLVGKFAGKNTTGSGNVMLGLAAGQFETGSNKLYIENSNTTSPLIYGDFATNKVGINTNQTPGTFQITNPGSDLTSMYLLPRATGIEDSSSVFFAEDNDAGYGMEILYDGVGNELEITGHVNGTVYGPHLLIKRDDGRVSIGGVFADGHKLSVDGKIACEEVLVDLSGDWPDYVFTSDYDLKTLKEVEAHIADKGHLPGVPSAQEVEDNGIKIGEMNRILMEKVEELTLYILAQEKRIEALENNK